MIVLAAYEETLLESLPGDTHLKDLTKKVGAWVDRLHLPCTTGLALAAAPMMEVPITHYISSVSTGQRVRPRDSLLIEPSLPTGRVMQALAFTGPAATFGGWPGGGWHALAWAIAQLVVKRTTHMLVGSWEAFPSRLQWLLLTTPAHCSASATIQRWAWQRAVHRDMTQHKSLLDFARFLQELDTYSTFEVSLPDGGLVLTCASALAVERCYVV